MARKRTRAPRRWMTIRGAILECLGIAALVATVGALRVQPAPADDLPSAEPNSAAATAETMGCRCETTEQHASSILAAAAQDLRRHAEPWLMKPRP